MTNESEFSRPVRIDTLGPAPRELAVDADAAERQALARRFDLPAIETLSAHVNLSRTGDAIAVEGQLRARVTQSCVASGEPVAAEIDAPFRILFSPLPHGEQDGEEEVELGEEDCDTVFYDGDSIDIGEAVAETLLLSLDPWPRAPDAEEALKRAQVKSEEEAGPFAALSGLRDKLK